ncbi:ribosomal-protein-alanine N-acetyltransferase [Saccharospirillum sp. MSK14-1]|uniref:ribosomal protein S18-alanine N-acetyltransferase n=1 Tax=Saccharospirillum sp. MSK14-1 TaxID=1897632 RepID=UPI000D379ADE|nr:ribosomal protein S18-alanine N-acetyltransferase [Saccharospirillum sp. MSK14-1]PTY37782.1 ribosomal-protein-alanine N-acetyltransferase [Saccharospirillum sp. MSK14-1]
MKLLPARVDDFNALVILDAEAGPHPWSVMALQQALKESRVWQIEHDGELAGFLVGESVLDESSLLHLAVARAYQGRGLARQALKHWLVQLHRLGQQRCILEVRPSNVPALAVYQGLGFTQIGQRRRYYADGEDAWVMALTL